MCLHTIPMLAYQDPAHPGNSASHHTGKPCFYKKCGRPAGTQWSPMFCFPCNVARMDSLNDSVNLIKENLERMVEGPLNSKLR